jgi:hypothetical protein
VIFAVWDEDGSQDGLDQENNHVPCIVISPYTHGVQDGTSYTHYSLLKTTHHHPNQGIPRHPSKALQKWDVEVRF